MLIIFMSIFTTPAFAQSSEANAKNQDVTNVAHRGASGHAPENTIAAFQTAFDMKADYIEIDVQMTKDGELVVIHDNTLDRTTNGSGFVGDYTLEELKQLDAGSWFGEEYAGEQIPTFEEVLDAFRGKIGILVEVKSPELYPGIEEKVADAIKERNMHKPNNNKVIIQSFNHNFVQASKSLLPSMPHGVLVGANWADVTDEALAEFAAYADYFNPTIDMATPDLVERIHNAGMKTWVYTVREPEQADYLLELGVDGIITDFPDYVYDHPGNNK